MILWLVTIAVGVAGTYLAYPKALTGDPRARPAAALRAIGLTLAAALGLNVVLGSARAPRPLVALDASASWLRGGDSTRFVAARKAALAAASDSVIAFGDSLRRATGETRGIDAASRLRTVAERAIAAGRPLVVFTDGELDDPDVLAGVPAGSRVEVSAASSVVDAAVSEVRAPRVASDGDTVDVRITMVAGSGGAGRGRVSLLLDGRPVASATIDSLGSFGERAISLRFVASGTRTAGANADRDVTAVVESAGDADLRNNSSSTAMEISSGSAAVLVSTSPDLDARELASLLRGTAALPTRAYFRIAAGQWREDGTLAPVSEEAVRRVMRSAPLVVLHGDTAYFGSPREQTRGALALVAPPTSSPGEYFATGAPPSPVSTMLTGTPWDSLPPLEVAAVMPPNAEFELLEVRRARRLDRRAAIVGWERPRRILVAGASGFWRWRFRGGAGADAFTAVWGSAFDWLAGERSDVRAAIPDAPSVKQGEPIRWRRGADADSVVKVAVNKRGEASAPDTVVLRFGATNVQAESPGLVPGVYDVQTAGGASLLVVNPSQELLPRRPTVRSGDYGSRNATTERPRARDWPWLFALAIAAFCAEWVVRRRAGLR